MTHQRKTPVLHHTSASLMEKEIEALQNIRPPYGLTRGRNSVYLKTSSMHSRASSESSQAPGRWERHKDFLVTIFLTFYSGIRRKEVQEYLIWRIIRHVSGQVGHGLLGKAR